MCFSAPVSFAAGGGLAVTGKVCLTKAKEKKGLRLIAAIPFVFAAQQIIEGAQWLFIQAGGPRTDLGYAFLVFAFLWWPVYVPLSMMVNETQRTRRRIQRVLLALGIGVSSYLLAALLSVPLHVDVVGRSIHYNIATPAAGSVVALYIAVVLTSFLIASEHFFRWFGLAVAGAAVVTGLFFATVFVSVWCFFVAVLSIALCFYVAKRGRIE